MRRVQKMFLRVIEMYDMKKFIREHVIEIENGAHFTPRMTWRRPLWFYYPTKRFPFVTIEVDEDIFPEKIEKDLLIKAEGIRIDNGAKVVGDLVKRPMIYFAVTNFYKYQHFQPLFYFCTEIFNKDGKFLVLRDEVKILEVTKIDRFVW